MSRLSPGRVMMALNAAALVGGVAFAVEFGLVMILAAFAAGPGMTAGALGLGLLVALLSVFNATIVFGGGLLVVGGPAWLILHRLGWRDRRAAVLSGALLSTIGGAVIVAIAIGPQGNAMTLWLAASMILPGGLAGWILHRIAYGPETAD